MIILAYDHGAYNTFQDIKKYLNEKGIEYKEYCSPEYDGLDSFAKYGKLASREVLKGNIGIFGCRSGVGMSMISNRHKGIRGALCFQVKIAEVCRLHNDANVCVLPCDYVSKNDIIPIIETFLNTKFLGGKYAKRLAELDAIEY